MRGTALVAEVVWDVWTADVIMIHGSLVWDVWTADVIMMLEEELVL